MRNRDWAEQGGGGVGEGRRPPAHGTCAPPLSTMPFIAERGDSTTQLRNILDHLLTLYVHHIYYNNQHIKKGEGGTKFFQKKLSRAPGYVSQPPICGVVGCPYVPEIFRFSVFSNEKLILLVLLAILQQIT